MESFLKGSFIMNKTFEITVKGMSCPHCEKTVSDAAMSVSGVVSAKASAKKSRLTVKLSDPAVLEKVKEAVRETDFEVV